MKFGSVSLQFLNDGYWSDDGGAMFGIVPREIWSRHKSPNSRNRIKMSLICPLVMDGSDLVLIDTGAGTRLNLKQLQTYEFTQKSALASSLGRLGLTPDDVTVVVLSHLHFDHCGGVVTSLDSTMKPTFPNARHIVQRREWETALNPPDPRTAAAYAHARECLEPLGAADLVELVDGDISASTHVRTIVTAGHSAGHQCVVVDAGESGLIYLADVAPTSAHLKAGWTMAYDIDPLETVRSKMRLLDLAAKNDWWVAFDHDDAITHGRIVWKEESKELVLSQGSCELV